MRRIPGRRPVPGGRRGRGLAAVCCALGAGLIALTPSVAASATSPVGPADPGGATGAAGATSVAGVAGAAGVTETAEPGGTGTAPAAADGASPGSNRTARETGPRSPGRADLAVRWEPVDTPASGSASASAGPGGVSAGPVPGPGTAAGTIRPGTTGTEPGAQPEADVTVTDPGADVTVTGPGGSAAAGAPGARSEATDQGGTPETAATESTPYTYRVSVENHGPSQAVDVVVTDRLPDSLVFVSSSDGCTADGQNITCGPLATLDVGETHTWLLTVRPADDYTGDGSDITNVAVVSSDTEDPDEENNTATHTGVPVTPGTGRADLALTKTSVLPPGRTDTVLPGDRFTYRITVRNNGPATAVGVRVTDALPAVLAFESSPDGCEPSPDDDRTVLCPVLDRLPAGESVTYELLVRVREDAELRGGGGGGGGDHHGGGGDHGGDDPAHQHRRCEIENTAYVTAVTRDPVPGNNNNRPGTTGPGGGPLYLEHPDDNGPQNPHEPHHPHHPQEPNQPHEPQEPHKPHKPHQLAQTGREIPGWLPWSAGLTLATGGALVLLSRRQLRAPGPSGTPEEGPRP
ncbi:DUF11 domain-containing protein [Streptomyces sp. NPDC020875]|uniref:DUF11 domain-containing protein n=1 Tax=Streptomyces sp. NPDC020875 TaxID=3154898 RepID=UPI003411040A